MLIIVDVDGSTSMGKKKKLRMRASFFGADCLSVGSFPGTFPGASHAPGAVSYRPLPG
jgi:hypothetical protein